MTEALRGLADAYVHSTTNSAKLPSHDSPAMAELAQQGHLSGNVLAQPVENAHSVAGVLTFAGLDHIRTYARLFEDDPTPTFSHLVVARAALLTFSAAAWLCDMGVPTAAERVKRHLVLDLEDTENLVRYGLPALKAQARARKALIRAFGADQGWQVVSSDRTRSVGGVQYPSTPEAIMCAITNPIRERGSVDPQQVGRVVWSYLSGISHGFAFALMQSIEQTETFPGADGLIKGTFGTRSDSVNVMGLALAAATVTACGSHLRLMGWTTESWKESVRQAGKWMTAFGDAAAVRLGPLNAGLLA